MQSGTVTDTIKHKIEAAFTPHALEIIDESEQHRGHGGWREGGESHFAVRIVSDRFEGLSRVARQRIVHQCLKDELAGPVHALSLTVQTPAEAEG